MLFEEIGIDVSYIVIILAAALLVLLILLIVCLVRLKKLRDRYERFMSGGDGKSLEDIFAGMVEDVNELKESDSELKTTLAATRQEQKKCYNRTGIVHYDAFSGQAGKLSFALAVLDSFDDGFLINSMYGNDGCYVYLKKITKGQADTPLGGEEKKALDDALKGNKERGSVC